MRSRKDPIDAVENRIAPEAFLAFTVQLLEEEFFNPVVFCHDKGRFDKTQYTRVMLGWINLLQYLDACGARLVTQTVAPSEPEAEIYAQIMYGFDFSASIVCYQLIEADFTALNTEAAQPPFGCKSSDFAPVRLYLAFRAGAALDKKAIEKIIREELSEAKMRNLRKLLEDVTGHKIRKKKDNFYVMR